MSGYSYAILVVWSVPTPHANRLLHLYGWFGNKPDSVPGVSFQQDPARKILKFDCYRTLESIRAYVLVSQDEPRIEVYFRQSDGSWRYEVAKGLDAVLRLEAIACDLLLAGAYARVEFPPAAAVEIAE